MNKFKIYIDQNFADTLYIKTSAIVKFILDYADEYDMYYMSLIKPIYDYCIKIGYDNTLEGFMSTIRNTKSDKILNYLSIADTIKFEDYSIKRVDGMKIGIEIQISPMILDLVK